MISTTRHATRQHPGYYEDGLQSSEVFAFDPYTVKWLKSGFPTARDWNHGKPEASSNIEIKEGIFRTPRDFARVYGLTKKQFEKLAALYQNW